MRGCDWKEVDAMEYVLQGEFLNSRRFGALPVESQAMRIPMDGKLRTCAYGPWKMRMSEWGKPAVHRTHTVMDIPYHRNRNERGYLLMLDGTRQDLDRGRKMSPTILAYCFLDAPYDIPYFCL